MRRHLDFCERKIRIEWRKCWIFESRTHCVPKFARKFFGKIVPRSFASDRFEKTAPAITFRIRRRSPTRRGIRKHIEGIDRRGDEFRRSLGETGHLGSRGEIYRV
jgi:hypothetical protein